MKNLFSIVVVVILTVTPAFSQKKASRKASSKVSAKASGTSATTVSAELTKGKLNSAESRPGDQVMLKLKDDVKSNGEVVLKKGTTITGVVRNVNRIEGKANAPSHAQSMISLEWFAPESQGRTSQQLSVALQSVAQVSSAYAGRQESDSDLEKNTSNSAWSAPARSAGLLGVTNVALLSMPSVVAADAQTANALQTDLGISGEQKLFQTGHGQIVSAGGSKQALDIFSHMNNDTVLTSRSRNFEITSGAQMQLLVGMIRN